MPNTKSLSTMYSSQRFPEARKPSPSPFKFLRNSCVPETKRTTIGRKSTFDPGPGRYELLDEDDLIRDALNFEKQKRQKFRRLPYKLFQIAKGKKSLTWRHIYGYGFKRLFQGPFKAITVPKKESKKLATNKTSKFNRINLQPSLEYIQMIINPTRIPLTSRLEDSEIKKKPKILRFNCMVKVIIRRQMRSDKKIAFSSGTPRFPDSPFPKPASDKSVKLSKLKDYPVMRIHPDEIKPKLYDLPERFRALKV